MSDDKIRCPVCDGELVEGDCPRCARAEGESLEDARRKLEETRERLGAWRDRLARRLDEFQKKRDMLSAFDARQAAHAPTTPLDEAGKKPTEPAATEEPPPPQAEEEGALERTLRLVPGQPLPGTEADEAERTVFIRGQGKAAVPLDDAEDNRTVFIRPTDQGNPAGEEAWSDDAEAERDASEPTVMFGQSPYARGEAGEATPAEPVFAASDTEAEPDRDQPVDEAPEPFATTPLDEEVAASPWEEPVEAEAPSGVRPGGATATAEPAPEHDELRGPSEPLRVDRPDTYPPSFVLRAAALILDVLILGLAPAMLVVLPTFVGLFGESPAQLWDRAPLPLLLLAWLLFALLSALYVGSFGRTPGLRLARLRVVDESGAPPTYTSAFMRALLFPLSLFASGEEALGHWTVVQP